MQGYENQYNYVSGILSSTYLKRRYVNKHTDEYTDEYMDEYMDNTLSPTIRTSEPELHHLKAEIWVSIDQ